MLQNREPLKNVRYYQQKVYHLLLDTQVSHWYKLKKVTALELNPAELQP